MKTINIEPYKDKWILVIVTSISKTFYCFADSLGKARQIKKRLLGI